MAAQAISLDRRQYPREGVIGQLEDIAYAAIRRYGVIGEVENDRMDSSTLPAAPIH